MDKTLNEFFEKLKEEGIQSHYSTSTGKIYINVTKNEEIDRLKPILKKFRLRLSFIDSANSNVILENHICEKEILINSRSMLLSVCVNYKIKDAETHLNKEGFSIGHYFPPVLTSDEITFADWLRKIHIPSMNYYGRDLAGNIRGIRGILPDGSRFESINAPKMAAGSDIIRLLLLTGQNFFSPTEITMKVIPYRKDIQILSFSSQKIKNLFLALSSIALKNIRIEFATLYTREEEHSDPILEIGYNPNGIYDFKNWIIRTVNNEGVSLINTVSDYNMVKERLNNLIRNEYQIEIHSKYKSIGRLCDILKLISQNVSLKGYLYRYEKSSFSFRIVIPAESFQQIKDNLFSECSKFRGELRLSESSENSSSEIPLSLYARIIHSCS